MRIVLKHLVLVIVPIFYQTIGSHSLIVPDQVQLALELITTLIPTIKKGTDSRFGWGFRLGDRADYQVLLEWGPQLNTQPLGNQPDNTNSKRNIIGTLSNELYAKGQRVNHEKLRKLLKEQQYDDKQLLYSEGAEKTVVDPPLE